MTELQPWQRPPFPPGNELSLKHGAYSPRKVDPLARQILEQVATEAYLAEPSFAAALWGWARIEARVQVVSEWLDEHGLLDDKGRPRPAADLLVRLERAAAEARSRLGLDPASRARMGRSIAGATFDLAKAWADADKHEQEESND